MTPLLQFSFRNLLTRPLRTVLSLIGLTVAIAAMVGLFSVANGLDRMIHDAFERIPGMIVVQPGAPIPLFSKLPAAWETDIADTPGIRVVNTQVWNRVQIIEGKQVFSPPRLLFGTDIASRTQLQHGVYRDAIKEGRFLELRDSGTLNTVISRSIADEFDKTLGETLRVDGNSLTIVGIYHCNSLFLDMAIILDIDAVRRISRIGKDTVSAYYVELADGANSDAVVDAVQDRFRGRKLDTVDPNNFLGMALGAQPAKTPNGQGGKLLQWVATLLTPLENPEAEPAFPLESESKSSSSQESGEDNENVDLAEELPLEIRSVEDWTSDFEKFSADLDIFLIIMTGIGITIAVVSILNTMLMSVTERSIEFGILKANGWSQRDILLLIGLESGILGVAGGVLGAAIGWVATLVGNYYWADRVYLYAGPSLLILSIAFSTLLGIVGGLYPAYLAARMTPMEAIRRG